MTDPSGRDTINTTETRQSWEKGRKTMYNTIDVNGVTYQPINDAERVNVGAPAVAMWELLAYIPTEGADDMGYYNLYALRYNDGDPDAIDWDSPADIVPRGGAANQAGYNPDTGHIC